MSRSRWTLVASSALVFHGCSLIFDFDAVPCDPVAPCSEGRRCVAGVCRVHDGEPVCGDGHVDPGEACDDGNADSDDRCDPSCQPASCESGGVVGDDANCAACGEDCGGRRCVDYLCQPLPGPCSVEVVDATTGAVIARTTYTYGGSDRVRLEERDDDGDGDVDYAQQTQYYTHGGPDYVDRDLDGNGSFDTRLTYRYDDDNRRIQTLRDDGRDLVVDAYANHGWPTDTTETVDWQLDLDPAVDRREIWIYDEGARPQRYQRDDGFDGSVEERKQWTYGSGGRLEEYTLDANGDDTTDQRTRYEHDELDNITAHGRDDGDDGDVDAVAAYVYDCWYDAP